ncbi:unnamed protein product [Vicia faba]|uniref:Reverse transcriptase domain-containing protein n=1 Tax=Vicia faba TaxID=3906 RepID=A0AAV0Z5N2_VICFA|nr:unnamed protein product [Vicia faba]
MVIPITPKEFDDALHGIGDLKAPGADGYSSKIFKSCWHIVKDDVVDAVKEFFEQDRLFIPFNQTVVTLVSKSEQATSVKDYRRIVGCTAFCKIISKALTVIMGKVLPSIVNLSQDAFIPGQVIHNHIMLAYELIKGYNRKWGYP